MPILTKSCKRILEVLRVNELSTAQEIHAQMRTLDSRAPGLSTVYRSLELMLRDGFLQAIDVGDGERRYEVIKPGEHHHHLICESCRTFVHLDECILADFYDNIRERYGFQIKEHVLEIFGRCGECQLDKPEK